MDTEFDLIIIGGGAAGLAAAQYGARANLKTLLVEELAAGGQPSSIDALENYPGVKGPVSGYDLSETMRMQAEAFGAAFLTATANGLRREDGLFLVDTSEGKPRRQDDRARDRSEAQARGPVDFPRPFREV